MQEVRNLEKGNKVKNPFYGAHKEEGESVIDCIIDGERQWPMETKAKLLGIEYHDEECASMFCTLVGMSRGM